MEMEDLESLDISQNKIIDHNIDEVDPIEKLCLVNFKKLLLVYKILKEIDTLGYQLQ